MAKSAGSIAFEMTAAERWNDKYRKKAGLTQPSLWLQKAVAGLAPGDALDLASGPGRNALYLAELGWNVTAVDVSDVAINRLCAESASRALNVTAVVADLEAGFPLTASSYDLVTVFFYLQRDLFPRIQTVLRPGGLFVAEIHMQDDGPDIPPMNPNYLLAPGELARAFNGFAILAAEEGRTEEAPHKRATARIIAQKQR
jgi:SAM-dependent methyltransferase